MANRKKNEIIATDLSNTLSNTLEESEKNKNKLPLFSSLPKDCKPLKELPPDEHIDTVYDTTFQPKCVICRSDWRTRIEHYYLECGRNVSAVQRFTEEYFGGRLTVEGIKTHMEMHCDFRNIHTSGIKFIVKHSEEVSKWLFREIDVAIAGILVEIDEIKGININAQRQPNLAIKRSAHMALLYDKLVNYKKIRDEERKKLYEHINIETILYKIYNEMPNEESKNIILKNIREIMNSIKQAGDNIDG